MLGQFSVALLCLNGYVSARAITERASDKGLFGNARVTFTNDWTTDLTVTSSSNKWMDKKLPENLIIPAGKTAPIPGAYVQTSFLPFVKAGFDVQMSVNSGTTKPAAIHIDLGNVGSDTSLVAASTNTEYESSVIMAPRQPLTTDVDYNIYFISGPGTYPPILNTLLASQIAPLAANLSTNPIAIPLPSSLSGVAITINGIPKDIKCTYASLVPSEGGKYNIRAVIEITGSITGNIAVSKLNLKDSFAVALTDLKLLVEGVADLSGGFTSPKINLSTLQTSLDGLAVSSSVFKAVGFLFPLLSKALGVPYDLAGYVNTQFNAKVLEAINNLAGGKKA